MDVVEMAELANAAHEATDLMHALGNESAYPVNMGLVLMDLYREKPGDFQVIKKFAEDCTRQRVVLTERVVKGGKKQRKTNG